VLSADGTKCPINENLFFCLQWLAEEIVWQCKATRELARGPCSTLTYTLLLTACPFKRSSVAPEFRCHEHKCSMLIACCTFLSAEMVPRSEYICLGNEKEE
jgi:hypothetical protein